MPRDSLRYINEAKPVDWPKAEQHAQEFLPDDRLAVFNYSRELDDREQAAVDSDYAATQARIAKSQEVQRRLNEAIRARESPTGGKDATRLDRQIASLEKQLAGIRAQREAARSKRTKRKDRMHSTRVGNFTSQLRGPQRAIPVDLGKYAKMETLAGIAAVQAEIAEKNARTDQLYEARLPLSDALNNWRAAAKRLANEAESLPFGACMRVGEGADGRFIPPRVILPESAWTAAVIGFLIAFGEDKITKHYAKLEDGFEETEFLSIPQRTAEKAKLDREIAELELIEGALTRKAISEGKEVLIRPTLSVQALMALEPDPNAKVDHIAPDNCGVIMDVTGSGRATVN